MQGNVRNSRDIHREEIKQSNSAVEIYKIKIKKPKNEKGLKLNNLI